MVRPDFLGWLPERRDSTLSDQKLRVRAVSLLRQGLLWTGAVSLLRQGFLGQGWLLPQTGAPGAQTTQND